MKKSNPLHASLVSAKEGFCVRFGFDPIEPTIDIKSPSNMISYTSNVTKSKKYQDIRGIVDSAKVKVLGVFVQFEIQSNSIQININLNDSNSSNESKSKNSKNPKSSITFGQHE